VTCQPSQLGLIDRTMAAHVKTMHGSIAQQPGVAEKVGQVSCRPRATPCWLGPSIWALRNGLARFGALLPKGSSIIQGSRRRSSGSVHAATSSFLKGIG